MGKVASRTIGKSPEAERKNTGVRGSRKTRLSHQEKILMGKGAVSTVKPADCTPWMGTATIGTPFDPEQAKKNWAEGLCN